MRAVIALLCAVVGCSDRSTAPSTAAPSPAAPIASRTPPAPTASAIARRELPGFHISLPTGEVAREEVAYADGIVALRGTHGESSMTMVMWIAGSTSPQDFIEGMGMMGQQFGSASTPEVSPIPGPTGVLSGTMTAGAMKVRMTSMPCGARVVQLLTASGEATNEALHRAIIGSFSCTPDQAGERAIPQGVVRYAMTLPGWTAIRKELDTVTLVAEAGMIILIDDHTDTMRTADVLASPKTLVTDVKMGANEGGRETFTATASVSVRGWIQVAQCAPQHRIFVVAIAPTKQGFDELTRLAKSGRCLRANEAPPVWPDEAAPK